MWTRSKAIELWTRGKAIELWTRSIAIEMWTSRATDTKRRGTIAAFEATLLGHGQERPVPGFKFVELWARAIGPLGEPAP